MQKKEQKTEERIIRDALAKYGRRAYDEALAEGYSPAVLRGNSICTVNPGGERVKVGAVKQARIRLSQYTFKIKSADDKKA